MLTLRTSAGSYTRSVTFATKSDICVAAALSDRVNVLELVIRILLLRVNVLDRVEADTD